MAFHTDPRPHVAAMITSRAILQQRLSGMFMCINSSQRATLSLSTGKWSLLAFRGHYTPGLWSGGKNLQPVKNAGHYENMDFTIHCIISAWVPVAHIFLACFTSIVIIPLTAWSSVVIKIPSRRQFLSLFCTFELVFFSLPTTVSVVGGKKDDKKAEKLPKKCCKNSMTKLSPGARAKKKIKA